MLDRDATGCLLLSDRILDCRRYHPELVDTTWRDSELRAWLNSGFLKAAFSDQEVARLRLTACSDNGDGTPDTDDTVFLLSVNQVRALTGPAGGALPSRPAISTGFARDPKPDGCRLYVYDKGVEKDYLVEGGERRGCSWWWTRTQLKATGGPTNTAAFVGPRGDVKSYGRVNLARYGVRPAVTVRIDADVVDATDTASL